MPRFTAKEIDAVLEAVAARLAGELEDVDEDALVSAQRKLLQSNDAKEAAAVKRRRKRA